MPVAARSTMLQAIIFPRLGKDSNCLGRHSLRPIVRPAIKIGATAGLFVWQFYGWGGLSAAQSTLNGPQRYVFNNSQFTDGGLIKLGKWTDFIFKVDWSTGAYTVWRRDEGQITFIEALSSKTPVPAFRDVYVKQGLYRGGNVDGRTDVFWIGPAARGSSFSAVERQAFGTDNGRQ